ncbi:MAG: RDD family protein [Actinomycetota bacterium]|nr:RDD family protein [Actinomycetota bacterium]
MVDREDVGSWLDGPRARTGTDQAPGARLGMPGEGPGSIARFGRRLVAILVDWVVANLVAGLLLGFTYASGSGSWKPLLVLFVENLLLVSTAGSTIGHRLVGLRLERLGGGRASVVQVLVRTVLLCLAVPALIWDRDGRGLHDRAANTVLVRA